jgi:hypothetical protein
MTLGNAAAARVRLIAWWKSCQHQVERDPAEMAERYGGDQNRKYFMPRASRQSGASVTFSISRN